MRLDSLVQLTEKSWLGVSELKVLIVESVAVDGLATSSITLGEVTTLDHELLDNTMERGTLITEALLTGCESAVLS